MGLLKYCQILHYSQVGKNPPHFFNPENCKCHDTKGLLKPVKIEKLIISASCHTELY